MEASLPGKCAAAARRVVREGLLPAVRRCVRLTGREQAAVALALLVFLLFAAHRGRGWL